MSILTPTERGAIKDDCEAWISDLIFDVIESAVVSKLENQEPFGYFRATADGWEDCAATDPGARPLYEWPVNLAEEIVRLNRLIGANNATIASLRTDLARLGLIDKLHDEYRSGLDDVADGHDEEDQKS